MNIAIIGADQNEENLFHDNFFQKHNLMFYNENQDFRQNIENTIIDFIICFNFYGFQYSTITDNLWYNILPIKQMHIITKKIAIPDILHKNPISIAMFFFCTNTSIKKSLENNIPQITGIQLLKNWNIHPQKSLITALEKTLLECGISF